MIKKIYKQAPIIIYNQHHDRNYMCREGVLTIEESDGKKYILNIQAKADITHADYLELRYPVDMQTEVLFENELYIKR